MSFLRKQESIYFTNNWIPVSTGMTNQNSKENLTDV
jgi:hypothetical protein